ncbi:kielin/chordin-like protein [Atheta coriaria]|uniref:kielin/chordin-like protein n=1 Tax=Dalotia coriaria TaxID=877792 RepID=UPI0031F41F87
MSRFIWFIYLASGLCVLCTASIENVILTGRITSKSPAANLPGEVNVLQLMNVSAKDPGVSLVEGAILKYPAYKFRLPYENVPLANSSAITEAMMAESGFTVLFLYRQQKNNLGTLISVNSPGKLTPWFQINSNLKTNTLTVRYILVGTHNLRQIDFKLPKQFHRKSSLAAWLWVGFTFDFKTGTVRLDLDCLPSQFELLNSKRKHQRITLTSDSLVYFRQEPGRKKKFLGSMQVAKILPYITEQRPWTCLQILEHNKHKPLVD